MKTYTTTDLVDARRDPDGWYAMNEHGERTQCFTSYAELCAALANGWVVWTEPTK